MTKRLAPMALAVLGVARIASADPVVNIPTFSPVYFQFNNLEQVSTIGNVLTVPGYAPAAAYGDGLQGNWGVFNISSIQNGFALPGPDVGHNDVAGGPGFYLDNGPGGGLGQVTGIFYGIDLLSPTTATGGRIDLYWQPAGSDTIDGSCLAGVGCLPNAATVSRFTTNGGAGIFLARLDFASGIVPGNDTVTLLSNTDPGAQGGAGHADSFANVVFGAGNIGPWSNILNGDWFFIDSSDAGTTRGDGPNETRDIRFSTFFNVDVDTWDAGPAVCPAVTPGGPLQPCTQGLRSNDPARVVTVPEPVTLTLLGVGLGAVAFRRRWHA